MCQYYEVFKQWDDPHQLPRYNTKQEPVVKAWVAEYGRMRSRTMDKEFREHVELLKCISETS